MGRTSKKSRKGQLALAREKKTDPLREQKTPEPSTASERKLRAVEICGEDSTPATQQWLLMHLTRINELIGDLLCPNCLGVGNCCLKVTIDENHFGFCNQVILACSQCPSNGNEFTKSVFSSTRLGESNRGDVAFDINTRMVLLSHELGLGYTALKKMGKVLGIPPFRLKTYQAHDRTVTGRL